MVWIPTIAMLALPCNWTWSIRNRRCGIHGRISFYIMHVLMVWKQYWFSKNQLVYKVLWYVLWECTVFFAESPHQFYAYIYAYHIYIHIYIYICVYVCVSVLHISFVSMQLKIMIWSLSIWAVFVWILFT